MYCNLQLRGRMRSDRVPQRITRFDRHQRQTPMTQIAVLGDSIRHCGVLGRYRLTGPLRAVILYAVVVGRLRAMGLREHGGLLFAEDQIV